MRHPYLVQTLIMASVLIASSAQCAVRAWVDTNAVVSSSSVELHLEHDGQIATEPDLTPLRQDFDILNRSRSSRVQIVNGNTTSSVLETLALSPKHSGPLTIPALTWGSEQSDPIALNATQGPASGRDNAAEDGEGGQVFLRTEVAPQRSYVQAGVDLTVRLYAATPLYHASLDFPANSDVLVQQVGSDKKETAVERGRRYQVIERHYALFPQRSGPLSLPGPVLDAQVPDEEQPDPFGSFKDFFGNLPFSDFTSTKPIRIHGADIALTVLPRPPEAGNQTWLPAQSLSLEAQWHPDHGQPKAGDPVTVDLHLEAQGLTAAQLPDLSALLNLPPGVKAYPDQPVLKNDTNGNEVVGTRDQSIALIAERAGDFPIPALSLSWWNTRTNKKSQATVPARTLTFLPGAASSSAPLAPQAQPGAVPAVRSRPDVTPSLSSPAPNSFQVWIWTSVILALLWLGTLVAWYLSRRRPAKPPAEHMPRSDSATTARKRFQEACKINDARGARAGLLEWSQAASSVPQPPNLHALARTTLDTHLQGLLLELDRACFLGVPWSGKPLLDALPTIPFTVGRQSRQREVLKSLYE